MSRFRSIVFVLLFFFLGSLVTPAYAQTTITLVSNTTSLTFPDSLVFNAEFQAGSNISSVVLEYGVNQLTCGTVQAKAFPALTPAPDVKVTWTWDMRQSGSLPPGASVWWFWQVTDAGGDKFTSPTQTVLWLDNTHTWQSLTGGNINLHYYNGDASFGQQLHDAAAQALVRLSKDVGVVTDSPVDIYIYANSDDLQASILYAPTWVGGQAYPENNIVIIGISPDQLDWGKGTEAHELTHVLVGHLTFSCLGFIPTWLNEGLAVYGEGGPQAAGQTLFDQAKSANQLPSLRSLAGAFSAESDRANLSYAEAYSVVNFILKTYGRDKMTSLLLDLRDGQTMDAALQSVYRVDTDGLENAWRSSIGANPASGSAQPTPIPTPTVVPTILPIGAVPAAAAVVPTAQPAQAQATPTPPGAVQTQLPTGTASPSSNLPGIGSSSLTTLLKYALVCLVIVVLLVGLIIFFIVRRRNGSSK
jgi:Peptidase MA superfamily